MLGNFVLPGLSQCENDLEHSLCSVEHQRMLCFQLVHGLKTILRVGRLGIEDQKNGVHEFLIYAM
jgi:hypothetical protein